MKTAIISGLFAFVCCYVTCTAKLQDGSRNKEDLLKKGEKKIGDTILMILDHYKQDNPVGIPGTEIPDPMPIPDMNRSFTIATMNFKNANIYGLSKFKVAYIQSEISSMEVKGALTIDSLQVLGNYTMKSWLSRAQGPFIVQLTNIYVRGLANLGVERDGKLRAQVINMDITFETIDLNFENLGFFGTMFQGILNSVGTFLFDSIKPHVLKEAYTTIREQINDNLEKISGDMNFPNSIRPLDMVIADTRTKIRSMGMDPYLVKNYNATAGMFSVELTNTWISGISSFYRVGNITLSIVNNSVIADFEIGTQKMNGQTQWDIAFLGGVMSRAGYASFTVEYINAKVIITQPLDSRKHPEFKDLQMEVGNIQVRCDGAGTLDYAIEFLINILPNLLRYQIIDALERPIQEKVQQMFDQVDVEDLIVRKIPEIEKLEATGFKLSSLKIVQTSHDLVDDDDFWRYD